MNFKPVSEHCTISPKATKNQNKLKPKINRIPTPANKYFLHNLNEMLDFHARHDHIQTIKSLKRKPGNQHNKKNSNVLSKWGPDIHPKSLKISLETPRCSLCCSFGFPRSLRKLLKSSSRVRKLMHPAYRMTTSGTTNDRNHFGNNNLQYFPNLKLVGLTTT